MPPPRGTAGGGTGKRALVYATLIGAAAAGYYLYATQGDPSKALHKAESDAKRMRERGLDGAESIGAKIDRGYDDARAKAGDAYSSAKNEFNKSWDTAESKRYETGRKLEGLVDKFDAKADEAASAAKSGIQRFGK